MTAMRASQTGPAAGLIAQVLLLAVLTGTAGLGDVGWTVGIACAVTMATALARGLARGPGGRPGPASWVTLARATLAVGVAALAADSLTHGTPVALLVTLAAVALGAGRGRRMGGAAHRDGDRAGGALRRRGRRVPDPRPQRLRRPHVRRVGARDRGRALPVPRRRVAAAVDARAAAAAPLAQGRRGDTGGRADGRGRRGPALGGRAGPPRCRARAAHGIDGRVHVVAVAPPARRARPDSGGSRRSAPGRAAAHRRRGGGHRCSPCCSSGPPSSRQTSRAASASASSHGSPSSYSSSSPWPPCCPPPRAACWPWSWARSSACSLS